MRRTACLVIALALCVFTGFPAFSCFAAQPASSQIPKVTVLAYHRFGPVVADSMTLTTPVFEWQLAYLRQHGYTVVPLADVVAYVKGQRSLPLRAVAITVDDGHRTVFTVMRPLV